MPPRANSTSFDHAVVLGGSIAGLLAARVLANHFRRVTIVERDDVTPDTLGRKGVPQGRHAHAVLAWGLDNMERLFPGLRADLIADGASPCDMARDFRWFQHGVYKLPFQSGFEAVFMSRPLLEQHIRRRVWALPNVECLGGTSVDGLLTSMDRSSVTGVVVRPDRGDAAQATSLMADFVVDASGRGSRTPSRLRQLGYDAPPTSEVRVDIGYATRLYRRADTGERPMGILISPVAPAERRVGVMLPLEGDRWILTLGGWHGDHAPTDEPGFNAFAQSLPAPDISRAIEAAEPLSDVMLHKLPSSLRHHYERVTRFPDRFVVIGDAIASFNPVYGQGMTSATLQALELDAALQRHAARRTLDGIWKDFFRRAAKVVDIPWQVTVGEDFRFPETQGKRPPLVHAINAYVAGVQRAAAIDAEVALAFLAVMNLQKSPLSIFAPRIVFRTWRALRARPLPTARTGAVAEMLASSLR